MEDKKFKVIIVEDVKLELKGTEEIFRHEIPNAEVIGTAMVVRLNEEIIHFATHYGTVQKELLDKFQIPYALLDAGGKILWMNEEFAGVSGKDKHYQKSISTVFREITKESLAKVQQDSFNVQVELNDRVYQASMQKLYFTEMGREVRSLPRSTRRIRSSRLLPFHDGAWESPARRRSICKDGSGR